MGLRVDYYDITDSDFRFVIEKIGRQIYEGAGFGLTALTAEDEAAHFLRKKIWDSVEIRGIFSLGKSGFGLRNCSTKRTGFRRFARALSPATTSAWPIAGNYSEAEKRKPLVLPK